MTFLELTKASFPSVTRSTRTQSKIPAMRRACVSKFESKGDANSVDSPATLYFTSETDVTVNGKKVGKIEEDQLSVGSEICFGSGTVYR